MHDMTTPNFRLKPYVRESFSGNSNYDDNDDIISNYESVTSPPSHSASDAARDRRHDVLGTIR